MLMTSQFCMVLTLNIPIENISLSDNIIMEITWNTLISFSNFNKVNEKHIYRV